MEYWDSGHDRKGTGFGGERKEIVQIPKIGRPKKKDPLNFEATKWAHSVPVFRPIQKSVLLVLTRHADRFGTSWCAQKTLAAQAGCRDRSVRTVLKEFEAIGLIRRIGRMGPNGGQLTDVVVLTGWPGRILIPQAGHPELGRYVKETPDTKLQWMQLRAQVRTEIPPEVAGASDQNKSILKPTITIQQDRMLEQCFEALGDWATAENMQLLIDDFALLLKWLEQGLELEHHILPVLAEKAKSEGKVPLIRTWKYFEKAIHNVAAKRRSRMRKALEVNVPKLQVDGIDHALQRLQAAQEKTL
ncbi:helix-turn-helix domain-containing protein [Paracoccus litorisediminis]|uniref:Helix-turn-helix domain-containing protein n=1 Tax=Paracoccus litorisediminis TaxID=2006130 RepID=A0A844HJ90_9RHOB|nr:helix-turn-helix domain-containing protein [Paracoccus litorisediminis]MTH60000.1 hypothetical protein [Paracoccus litorisediminis]